MEPEQLRDCPSTTSNCVAVDLSPECPQQQSRFSASSLVQDLIETIMEVEEEDEEGCHSSDFQPLEISSPLANSNNQIENIFHLNPESPLPNRYPLPPTNTPSTGHDFRSHHHHHLAGIQAANKLAMVTHHTYHQGLQLLRDSLSGLCREEQLQGDEDLLTTAADFIQFCRRQAGKDLEKMFKAERVI